MCSIIKIIFMTWCTTNVGKYIDPKNNQIKKVQLLRNVATTVTL